MTDRLDHAPAMSPAAGPATVRQPEVAIAAAFPDAAQFVDQLKRKADVASDHWSDSPRVSRFTAESFGGPFRAG